MGDKSEKIWVKRHPVLAVLGGLVALVVLPLTLMALPFVVGWFVWKHTSWAKIAKVTVVLCACFVSFSALAAMGHSQTAQSKPKPTGSATPNTAAPSPSPSVSPEPSPGANGSLGTRTKTSGCVSNGALQDKACTPGAVFAAGKDEICVSGYTSRVRNVPESEKAAVYAEYGVTSHTTGEYEIDHLIPLELGGSNDISNLWPEPANPTPGFHQKDTVENSMHAEMCGGSITLSTAQMEIADNWLSISQGAYTPSEGAVAAPHVSTPVPTAAPAGGVIKMSTSHICHAPGDAYYDRTINYTAYPTMDACVAAGGRPSER